MSGHVSSCFYHVLSAVGIRPSPAFPDFTHYRYLQTLTPRQFPIDSDDGRIIAIGDIHGMNESFSALLTELSYDPRSDTLIHLGDIVAKGGTGSLPVITFMTTNNILGVRGNNDQKVIEWRAWMDWILSLPGGGDWLLEMDRQWPKVDGDKANADFDIWLKKSHKHWGRRVPEGWKPLGNHYRIARSMSQDQYDYLRSLPLILYAPTGHTYFVHAGMLAADPNRKATHPKQPLSHWPAMLKPKQDISALRGLQELALLNDIPQNKDPWVLMNMRSIRKDGTIKQGKKGTPWSDVWNGIMYRCSGLDGVQRLPASKRGSNWLRSRRTDEEDASPLQCFPSMVVYGHAAARGLDVKRWSIGIDTGCTNNRRLTALVLDKQSLSSKNLDVDTALSPHTSYVPYGDNGRARITSVKC
ncbi:hypothetical protein HYDPIDRAFT_86022 [Hydnomerulius pinastri MD-312]|nr:hypothetical protein HYDPIDRAFT_86022 [Hydnomerulius pinastri MD-312]